MDFDVSGEFQKFKGDFVKSKKYWLIYLVIIVFISLSLFRADNYAHPKMEIIIIILVSLLGIFTISYYQGHNDEKELYKTAFLIILIFGIICCLLIPICNGPDEVEHFVRSEMTSSGVIIPDYKNGSFQTIQSTLDLIEKGKTTWATGFDAINRDDASIFNTNADTQPINYTLVKYPSAFAQNPFFGYIAPAIGMAIAKLFDLNAIWLLWLGRIFNILLYASLVAVAVKKTPILKIPMIVIACMPLLIFQASTVAIDSLINGLGILAVAYFFKMYKSPKNQLDWKNIVKFSLIVLLMGLCKVTYFAFIFLLIFIPLSNFKDKKYYLYGFVSIIIMAIVALLWAKYYATPGFFQSFRSNYWIEKGINSTQQTSYILSHKKEMIMTIFNLPQYFNSDLLFRFESFNSLYLLLFGGVCLFYPHEKYNIKSRIGALIVCVMVYVGTYVSFLLTWTPVGQLDPIIGVQQRYFLPILFLMPFIFGFNHTDGDKKEIDSYLIMLSISFIAYMLIWFAVKVY